MKISKIRGLLIRIVLCVLAVLVLVPAVGVSAVSDKTDEIGYDSYTYWYNFTGQTRRIVPTKPMYEVSKVFTSQDLGCTTSKARIYDTYVAPSGLTYVIDGALSGGNARVLILNKDYSIKEVWNYIKGADGSEIHFNFAQGIFVDKDENVYIADTYNARVIKCDSKGNLVRLYLLPDSHLIPSNFNYMPVKVAVDSKGYVYILSNSSYYGAILYSPNDEFLGFYGSNNVAATLLQALGNLWNKLVMTDAKYAASEKVLPFSFNDLWVDADDFIYTVTGSSILTGQVKRLNPGGDNILPSEEINFVDDLSVSDPTNPKEVRNQDLVGVAADDDGFIYVLDKTYGRIYVYDNNCTLISTFGGGIKSGGQDGTFYNPVSISYNKESQDIIVTDDVQNTMTVFKITEYGKLIKSAQAKTMVGDYEEALAEWTEVLDADRNCQLAYSGLAKAYYAMAKTTEDPALYDEYINKSIDLAKQGYDRETYALAFEKVRTEWLRDNFTWVLLIAVVLVAGVIVLLVYSTKHKMRLVKNEKLHLATTMVIHPFENFRDIKEKNLTSIPICLVIIVLYYIFDVMTTTMGGFAFTYFDPSSYNALLILAKTAGLVILWTVTNWAVCTLLSGKGKIKEIFTVISYSLIPSLITSLVYIVFSNLLVPSEATFLDVLMVVGTMYTVLMLMAGSLIVHDYTLSKFIGTTILTLFGCGIVIFLLIAVGILLQQTGGFIGTIYSEILKLF